MAMDYRRSVLSAIVFGVGLIGPVAHLPAGEVTGPGLFVQDDPEVPLVFTSQTPSPFGGVLSSASSDGGYGGDLKVIVSENTTLGAAEFRTDTGIVNFDVTSATLTAGATLSGPFDRLVVQGGQTTQNATRISFGAGDVLVSDRELWVYDTVFQSTNAAAVADGSMVRIGTGASYRMTNNNPISGSFHIEAGGALYIPDNQPNRLSGGAIFSADAGALLVLRGGLVMDETQMPASLIGQMDLVLDRSTAVTLSDGFTLGEGRRITSSSTQNGVLSGGLISVNPGQESLRLSAASGRTLTINNPIHAENGIGWATMVIGDDATFTTVTGNQNLTRANAFQSGTVIFGGSGTELGDLHATRGTAAIRANTQVHGTTVISSGATLRMGSDGVVNLQDVVIEGFGRIESGDNQNRTLNILGEYEDTTAARIFSAVVNNNAGIYWANGQTNTVHGRFLTALQREFWTVGAKNGTTVLYRGSGASGGATSNNQSFWFRVEEDSRFVFTEDAGWNRIASSNGSAVNFISNDRTGIIEFEEGFSGANMGITSAWYSGAGRAAEGITLFGVTWITHDSGNLPSGFATSTFSGGAVGYPKVDYAKIAMRNNAVWHARSNDAFFPNRVEILNGGEIRVDEGVSLNLTGSNPHDPDDLLWTSIQNTGTLTKSGLGTLEISSRLGGHVQLSHWASAGGSWDRSVWAEGNGGHLVVAEGTLLLSATPENSELTPLIDESRNIVRTLRVDSGASLELAEQVILHLSDYGSPSVSIVEGDLVLGVGAAIDLINNELHLASSSRINGADADLFAVRDTIDAQGLTSSIALEDARYGVGYEQIAGGTIRVRHALLGDTNLDGTVDDADLMTLQANLGSTAGVWGQGDFSADGVVSLYDAFLLFKNYEPANVASTPMVIPEPAGIVLLALGGLGLLGRGRRS